MKSIALCKNIEVLFALPRFAAKKAMQALGLARAPGYEPKRVLVACIAHMGDTLCALPALHALRCAWPHARIFLTCPGALASFIRRAPFGITPLVMDDADPLKLLKALVLQRHFDEGFVIWHRRDVLLAQALGCCRITAFKGFSKGIYTRLIDEERPEPACLNLEERICSMLGGAPSNERGGSAQTAGARAGITGMKMTQLGGDHCNLNRITCRFILSDWYPELSFPRRRNQNVFLQLGAKSGARLLPPACWQRIASLASSLGFHVILSGERSDARIADVVDPKRRLERALGRFSLDELALELAKSALLVTVDTGIMHLAKFTGVPVVALLAGTPCERVRPSLYFENCPFHAFQADVKCERKNPSCSALLRFCLQVEDGYSRCMRQLPMEGILSCIEGILKGEARA